MLILTRRPGETILIDDDIEVMVLAVNNNQIRLGIKAPEEVPIVREELLLRDPTQQDCRRTMGVRR